MGSVQSVVTAQMPAGVFVRHACAGAFIEVVSYRGGEHRSLTVSEKRAIGLMQQLTAICIDGRPFRVYDERGDTVGDIGGDHVLKIIADLATAVRTNRHHAKEQRRNEA